ncbi:MAG: hypothetical protein LKI98_07060, partial [Bifidobacterium crudilactis]|nr:hypothetical protein [Bifidobacterium crudilactis]
TRAFRWIENGRGGGVLFLLLWVVLLWVGSVVLLLWRRQFSVLLGMPHGECRSFSQVIINETEKSQPVLHVT